MTEWKLTLDKYQRDNLLSLLNACGYPYGQGGPPFTVANTGDWMGEITLMLADEDGSIIIGKNDRPNATPKELLAWAGHK